MDTHTRPSAWTIIGRALRLRCPVCGVGHMFHGMRTLDRCPHCGFMFEREDGYWSNAAVVNFSVIGTVATLIIAPMALLSGWSLTALLIGAVALTVGLALICFWHIKALWLAFDIIMRPPTAVEQMSGYLATVRQPPELIADKYRE